MATAALEAQGYTAVPVNVDITRGDEARKVTWAVYAPFTEITADAVGGGVTFAALTDGLATLTTSTAHGLTVGDWVVVSASGEPFDGSWIVESTPLPTTFTFRPSQDDIALTPDVDGTVTKSVATTLASLTDNVVTLTTATAHNYIASDSVVVAGISGVFNGTYTVTGTPTTHTLTYAKTNANVPEAAAASGTIKRAVGGASISKKLVDNVATITTTNNHGLLVGETVVLASFGDPFDGTWEVAAKTAKTLSFTLIAEDIPNGAKSGVATATSTKVGEFVSATLTPNLADPNTTQSMAVSGEMATASKTYELTDSRMNWKIEFGYYTRETTEAQHALQNYRLEQSDVVAQIPVASEVERNQHVTLVRARKSVITGTIWPQTIGDDWSVVDADDYSPALQYGIFTGTDPTAADSVTAGPNSGGGVAGIGASVMEAIVPGASFEVADPTVTPTVVGGFIPVYKGAWFKNEHITLVPSLEATSEKVPTYWYYNGLGTWVSGNNSGGTPVPVIDSVTINEGSTSTVHTAGGGVISVSGLTLAGLKKCGGGKSATRWPAGAYITVLADGVAGTGTTAHWDGVKWADGVAPTATTFTDPYDAGSTLVVDPSIISSIPVSLDSEETDPTITVTLTGTGFQPTSDVSFDGGTTWQNIGYISSTSATIVVTVDDLEAGTPLEIDMKTGEHVLAAPFEIEVYETPTCASSSPASLDSEAAGPNITVTLTGTGFIQGVSDFTRNGGASWTLLTVVSDTEATFSCPVSSLTAGGSVSVIVRNGGGASVSAPLAIPVLNLTPTLVSSSPATYDISDAGAGPVEFTLTGTKFQPNVEYSLNGGTYSAVKTYTSATSAKIDIPVAGLVAGVPIVVRVRNGTVVVGTPLSITVVD